MKYTPNGQSWVGFCATLTGTLAAPKLADITAAINLTALITGLTASTTGSAVPTPTFDTTFNTSIPGNVDGTLTLDGYRDTVLASDLIWTTLPRGTVGTLIIARASGGISPTTGGNVECWPIAVLSRSVPNMTSNTVVTVTVTCSIPQVPNEAAVVST